MSTIPIIPIIHMIRAEWFKEFTFREVCSSVQMIDWFWLQECDVWLVCQVQGEVSSRVQQDRRVSCTLELATSTTQSCCRTCCTYCGGDIEASFTPVGIVSAILLFPIGLAICCYLRERKCVACDRSVVQGSGGWSRRLVGGLGESLLGVDLGLRW